MRQRAMMSVFGTTLLVTLSLAAQQSVTTTGGQANAVPLFTGTSSISDSVMNQSNGQVGIGTSAPAEMLDVAGAVRSTISGDVGGAFSLENPSKTTAGTAGLWKIYNMTGGYGNSLQFWAYDNIGCVSGGLCASRLTLTDSGHVGVGTWSPTQSLQLGNGFVGIPSHPSYNNIPGSFQRGNGGVITASSQNSDGSGWAWGARQIVYDYGDGLNYEIDNLNNASWYNSSLVISGRTGRIGYVGIGTGSPSTKLEVNGSMKITAGSGGTLTFPDGTTQSTAWTGVLCGGDYAESVGVSGRKDRYEPGDVLVIDPADPEKFLKSSIPYSTTVAGIYSTKPGVTGRRSVSPATTDPEIPMAMVGIVPTKVSAENGTIRVGDLLVTSRTVGYAMRSSDHRRMLGAVVGKALGSLSSGKGVINVLVTLQ